MVGVPIEVGNLLGRNLRGIAGQSREQQHKVRLQVATPVGSQNDRRNLIAPIAAELDTVEASVSRPDLILRPNMFLDDILFYMDGFIGQFPLPAMPARERMESVEQADRERRRRAKTGPRRQVTIVLNFQPIANTHFGQHCPYHWMLDLGDFLHVLDERINDAVLMVEEGWQTAHADVAIPVYR